MSIAATGGASISAVPTTMDFGAGAVSPEAILEYCSMRLNDIDGQVDKLMTQQDKANSVSTNLDAINEDLQKYTDGYNVTGVGGDNSKVGTTCDQKTIEDMQSDVDSHYQAAIDAANDSGDSTLAATLTTAQNTFDSTTKTSQGGDDCMSAKEISDTMDGIKNAESDSSNNSQMVMLNLQQLLSSRQQIITMASNMTQTTDDTDKAVINNIHSS
jgi:hypothetical protein